MGLASATGEPSLEVVSCCRFDKSTNHNALSSLREKTFEIVARISRKAHDIDQIQKVIPLISRETSFGQNVSESVFSVNILDLDRGFQVDSVKQPVKSNSEFLTHVSLWDFVL